MSEEDREETAVHHRYHVGDGETLFGCTKKKEEAFTFAVQLVKKHGGKFYVYDSMSRKGQRSLWSVERDPDGNYVALSTAGSILLDMD